MLTRSVDAQVRCCQKLENDFGRLQIRRQALVEHGLERPVIVGQLKDIELLPLQIAKRWNQRRMDHDMRTQLWQFTANPIEFVELAHALDEDFLHAQIDLACRELAILGWVQVEQPLLPGEHPVETFERLNVVKLVNDRVRDDSLLQEDSTDVIVRANGQDAALLRGSTELQ